ncbi:MAG: cobalamin synthesis protein P47K [Lentisphaerae bacterium]|jgi:G3E family GTPase|nr:cobalamin synthesis protein P47K [Lentisphaerota bacterium]MBT4817060.1 cobalamin synthesis protein P47K [Lentisphaerota bacterium]MBT5609315.1 cobalamin synthesis protein P47K [Lentisphaerota bacterium]MBT7059391.1 cobalamin synthesis protein P47K [Lentisphaerota bacterium]MBT7847775.1 cobalamin synthesis protein P47K [Lentisphaerota bacterium]
MNQVKLIFVGGFLGAGKTTLLGTVAKKLASEGKRVGLITNDQADDLVDTGFLKQTGSQVKEVAGGCFCCRFDDLVNAAEKLLEELKPDVLLGEPVGSCTDISATVLQPMKELYGDWFEVAPFSVLADPHRLRQALSKDNDSGFPDNVLYIFRKQLDEADVIVMNKVDLLSPAELDALRNDVSTAYPDATILTMSGLTGDGVDPWLELIQAGGQAGKRILDVDYDRYADGEAVLGWLNATVQLHAPEPTVWTAFTEELIGALKVALGDREAEIAHLKTLLTTPSGSITANVTNSAEAPSLRGSIAEPCRDAALIVNARVHISPEALEQIVRDTVTAVCGDSIEEELAHVQSLSPGRPTPVHRYDSVI